MGDIATIPDGGSCVLSAALEVAARWPLVVDFTGAGARAVLQLVDLRQ
jgi:hypothetical protein